MCENVFIPAAPGWILIAAVIYTADDLRNESQDVLEQLAVATPTEDDVAETFPIVAWHVSDEDVHELLRPLVAWNYGARVLDGEYANLQCMPPESSEEEIAQAKRFAGRMGLIDDRSKAKRELARRAAIDTEAHNARR